MKLEKLEAARTVRSGRAGGVGSARRISGWRLIAGLGAVAALFGAGMARQPERSPAPAPSGSSASATDETKAVLPESWTKAFSWRSVGPANMGGRITSIAVSEQDTNMWWAATASGGLLKTTNNGITFEHQFDKEATVSIGDVAVAPSDHTIVWVGTGENNPRNSVSWGDGVYKSVDGGKTWKNMGLKKGFQTGKIVIHPKDPNIVYVGVLGRLWGPSEERGLYKTTDGGTTWERVHYVDDKTGVTDIQMKPGEPDTLLVATYERQRDGFDTNEPAKRNGPGSGLWKTTDGGKNWDRLYQGLPEGNVGRMGIHYFAKNPDTVYLIIESDRTGSEPANAPYIGLRGADADVGARITDVTKGGPAEAAGLKVDDIVIAVGGVTVHTYNDFIAQIRKRVAGEQVTLDISREKKSVNAELKLATRPAPAGPQRARDGTGRRTDDTGGAGPFSSGLGGQRGNLTEQQGPDGHQYGGVYKSTDGGESWKRINSLNPRPMYFSQIRADPNDDSFMWVLGVSLARSKDAGQTFTDDGGRGTHADHHALWIDPKDGRRMILGNDGGIYLSYDRGENWDHLNHVAIGQFYHVAVDPRPNYMIYGGLQDNGSWGGPSRSRNGRGPINEDWISIGGGDGFVCRVDPLDPDQIYYESQGGAMGRTNLRTGERGSIRPPSERGLRYRWNWKTPFVLSSHNSKIFYAAAQYVFRSLDQGRTMKRISDEFTRTRRGSGTALAESSLDSDVLYVGSDDGALLATRDGGMTWTTLADFPLSEEERNFQSRVEESESGGGGGAAPTPPPSGAPAAEAAAASPETPPAPEEADQPAATPDAAAPGGRPTGAGGGAERMLERLRGMDANKDGKVAKDEVPEQMQRLFDRADANTDGTLDEEEMKAMAQRMPTGGGRGGRGGAGGRFGGEQPAASDPSRPRAGMILPAQAVAPQPEQAAPVAAGPDDPITGDWTARPTSAEAGGFGTTGFTLTMTLATDGKVTGTYEAASPGGGGGGRGGFGGGMGGPLTNTKFDRATGQLTGAVDTERMEIAIKGKLENGKLKGDVDIGEGRFQFAFEAERTSTTPGRAARANDTSTPGGKALNQLLPGARWVSSIEASRFRAGRVYVTFDGHRSNDDEPYVMVSEDFGRSWRSIRGNLPTEAGSVKVLREDLQQEDLLFLGTEFGAYVSIDRGNSWTRFNNNLPTVAVFEFALHPTTGELIAGTHGRSIWITDITPLRQMSDKTVSQEAALFTPRTAVYWRADPRRGGDLRRFVGENDETGASIVYAINKRARAVTLQIMDPAGEVIRELEPVMEPGLHRITWDLRRAPENRGSPGARAGAPAAGARGGGGGGFGGFGGARGGRLVPSGTYRVALKVDGEEFTRSLVVQTDPQYPDYQPWERAGGAGGEEDSEEEQENEHEPAPLDRDD